MFLVFFSTVVVVVVVVDRFLFRELQYRLVLRKKAVRMVVCESVHALHFRRRSIRTARRRRRRRRRARAVRRRCCRRSNDSKKKRVALHLGAFTRKKRAAAAAAAREREREREWCNERVGVAPATAGASTRFSFLFERRAFRGRRGRRFRARPFVRSFVSGAPRKEETKTTLEVVAPQLRPAPLARLLQLRRVDLVPQQAPAAAEPAAELRALGRLVGHDLEDAAFVGFLIDSLGWWLWG